MRKVHLVCSLLLAFSASMLSLGCGGAKPGADSKASSAASAASSEKTLALRWLPADTEVVIQVKLADLWQAPLLKSLIDSPQVVEVVGEMKKTTGLTPADIESVTIGGAKLEEIQSSAMGHALGMPGPAPKGMVIVIRTKKAANLEELVKTDELKSAEHKSKKYFEAAGKEFGVWAAEPTTLIVAPLDDVKAAIERGETAAPRKELSFMDSSSHLVIVVAPKDTKTLGKGMESPLPPDAPAEVVAMQKTIVESLSAVGFGINVRGGFDIQTSLMLGNAEGAGKVKSGFEAAIKKGKGEFEGAKANLPPLLADLAGLLIDNVKVDSQTSVVTLSTKVPDSAQNKLEELPELAAQFGLGGFSPFGGGHMESAPKKSKSMTGRKPKVASPGSTTGGGVEVPTDPAGGTEEKPEVKKPETKVEEKTEEKVEKTEEKTEKAEEKKPE